MQRSLGRQASVAPDANDYDVAEANGRGAASSESVALAAKLRHELVPTFEVIEYTRATVANAEGKRSARSFPVRHRCLSVCAVPKIRRGGSQVRLTPCQSEELRFSAFGCRQKKQIRVSSVGGISWGGAGREAQLPPIHSARYCDQTNDRAATSPRTRSSRRRLYCLRLCMWRLGDKDRAVAFARRRPWSSVTR